MFVGSTLHNIIYSASIFKIDFVKIKTMTQQRLAGLILPFVEQDLTDKLCQLHILQYFVHSENKRLDFGL